MYREIGLIISMMRSHLNLPAFVQLVHHGEAKSDYNVFFIGDIWKHTNVHGKIPPFFIWDFSSMQVHVPVLNDLSVCLSIYISIEILLLQQYKYIVYIL